MDFHEHSKKFPNSRFAIPVKATKLFYFKFRKISIFLSHFSRFTEKRTPHGPPCGKSCQPLDTQENKILVSHCSAFKTSEGYVEPLDQSLTEENWQNRLLKS